MDSESITGEIKPGDWRKLLRRGQGMQNPANIKGRRVRESAMEIREAVKDYVNSDVGAVEWQIRHVNYLGPTTLT